MRDLIIPWDHDRDLGTPESHSHETVTLTIDGFEVTVPEGTSVTRAAALAGLKIPKLCATDSVEAFGSCRLCVVEIDGRRGTPASCTTPAEDGLVVHTQTERIRRIRTGVMELYISDHPLDCLTCSANGDCELQNMAGMVGLRDMRYEPGQNHYDPSGKGELAQGDARARGPQGDLGNPLFIPKDDSNPYFTYDPSKCIVCSRCVRACEEVQGTFALTIEGRGFDSRVSAGIALDDFLSSDCVSCGAVCRPARPRPAGEIHYRTQHAQPLGHHDLRLLRRRLLVQGRAQWRPGSADDAIPPRQGQPWPFLRQGPLRLWLYQPQGPHPEADDPRPDRRALARGRVGGGDHLCRHQASRHPGNLWPPVDRLPDLPPLHD